MQFSAGLAADLSWLPTKLDLAKWQERMFNPRCWWLIQLLICTRCLQWFSIHHNWHEASDLFICASGYFATCCILHFFLSQPSIDSQTSHNYVQRRVESFAQKEQIYQKINILNIQEIIDRQLNKSCWRNCMQKKKRNWANETEKYSSAHNKWQHHSTRNRFRTKLKLNILRTTIESLPKAVKLVPFGCWS